MVKDAQIKIAFEVFIFLLLLFTLVWNLQSDWQFYSALMPLIFSTFGAVMSGLVLLRELVRAVAARKAGAAAGGAAATTLTDMAPTMLKFFAWLAVFYVGVIVIGFLPTRVLATVAYMRLFGHTNWVPAIVTSVAITAICYGLYETLLHIVWPVPLIAALLP